jgi:hypothetical protein
LVPDCANWISGNDPENGAHPAHGPIPAATAIPPALLYTIPEVMALLKLGKTQVFDEMRRGRIQSVTVGRARRVPAQSLTAYVALLIHEAQESAA